ncbi:MAG: hypothetical protein ABIN05_02760 [candidate division WOR-3 bacterium]
MNKKIFCSILLILIVVFVFPEKVPIPTDYPTIFPSARIRGLGGNGTSIMGDISSTFYNPATLSGLNSGGISLSFETDHFSSYAEFLQKEQSIYGKNVSFFTISTYQGGLSYMPLFKISYRDSFVDSLNIERDFEMKLDQYWLSLTSFTGFNEKFSSPIYFGINLKYLNGKIAEAKLSYDSLGNIIDGFADISYGNGYGLDGGLIVSLSNLFVSLVFRDILTHIYWDSYDKQIIPMNGNLGVSFVPISNLLFNFNVSKFLRNETPFVYTLGGEYTFFEISEKTNSFWDDLKKGSPSIRIGTSFKEIPTLSTAIIDLGLGYNSNSVRVDLCFESTLERYYIGKFDYYLTLTIPITI